MSLSKDIPIDPTQSRGEGAHSPPELRSIKRELDHSENECHSPVQRGVSQSLLTAAPLAKAPTEKKVDALQAAIERMPQAELPLTHRFAPGMYIRTIFMPKGALVISKIHRTQHPFVVTKGRCAVWDEQSGVREIKAGHIGVTMPGTRRVVYIYEDTEWTTFHATDKTTPEEVEADIIEPHDFDREEALAHLGRMVGFVDGWINGQRPPGSSPLIQQSNNPTTQ